MKYIQNLFVVVSLGLLIAGCGHGAKFDPSKVSITFHIVESSSNPLTVTKAVTVNGAQQQVHLVKSPVLDQNHIKTISKMDSVVTPVLSLTFDDKGRDMFALITKDNVGKQLGIVIDGKLVCAPIIKSPITGGSCTVSGLSEEEIDAIIQKSMIKQ